MLNPVLQDKVRNEPMLKPALKEAPSGLIFKPALMESRKYVCKPAWRAPTVAQRVWGG